MLTVIRREDEEGSSICAKTVGIAAAAALAMTMLMSLVANAAGTSGCYAYTAVEGHQLGSFCPLR